MQMCACVSTKLDNGIDLQASTFYETITGKLQENKELAKTARTEGGKYLMRLGVQMEQHGGDWEVLERTLPKLGLDTRRHILRHAPTVTESDIWEALAEIGMADTERWGLAHHVATVLQSSRSPQTESGEHLRSKLGDSLGPTAGGIGWPILELVLENVELQTVHAMQRRGEALSAEVERQLNDANVEGDADWDRTVQTVRDALCRFSSQGSRASGVGRSPRCVQSRC